MKRLTCVRIDVTTRNSAEVFRVLRERVVLLHIAPFGVLLRVVLPPRALVVHRVLQAVPVFVIGGGPARVRVPRAPVLVEVLESGQVPM